MITVSLKLYGDLRKYAGRSAPDRMPLSLDDGATIADLTARLGMSGDDEVIAGVNGEQAHNNTVLKHGDDVLLVSPMEGG